MRERTERGASRDISLVGGAVPFAASVRRRGGRAFRRGFDERIVRLVGLPRGTRVLGLVGYANVIVLLAILLFLELSGQRLANVVAFDVDAAISHEVPFTSVVFSLVAFMVGWSLVLTGASDCRRRVFIPVLGLFVLQMFLLTQVFGEARWDSQAQAWWMTVGVATVVAGIHLFTHRLRQWRDLPLAEFCMWLLVMLVLLVLLLRLPQGEVAQRVFWVSFFGMFVTTPFWLVLGLEIIDLSVTIPRWFVLGPVRRLPDNIFSGLAVSGLVVQIVFASVVLTTARGTPPSDTSSSVLAGWVAQASEAFPPYLAYACAFDLLLVVPILVWGVAMGVRRRWTVSVATLLSILGLAAPVITFGGSLALWGGKDFAEAGLSAPHLIPPFLLFAGLLIYDVLNFGARFANSDGQIVPRSGRVLIYFGVSSLVLSVALINVDEHSPTTGQPGGTMEFYIDFLFAIGVLLFGPPYLAWMVWRRRGWLVGEETDQPPDHPVQEVPHWDETTSNRLSALVGGSVCGILGYFVSFLILALGLDIRTPFRELGMVAGAVSWTAAVLCVALSVGFVIWYFGNSLSWNAIGALASGALVYAAMGVFVAWLTLVYAERDAQQLSQTMNTETFQPALALTVDGDWKWQETSAAVYLSRGEHSGLSVLNVRGVYDTPNQNGGGDSPSVGQIVDRLHDYRYIRITSTRQVTFGGEHGIQLDAEIVSLPDRQPEDCSDPCLPLFRLDDNGSFWIWQGNRARISILRRGSDTVVILSQSPAEKFDRFAPESSEVLGTLQWRYLAPGDYTFDRFDPPLSLRLGDGWDSFEHLPDYAALHGGAGDYLGFVNVRRIYDPETPNPSGVRRAPNDLVGWFEDHQYLKVENLRTGKVGGVSGPRFDVVVPPLPPDYTSSCGEACVPLFFLSNQDNIVVREGYKYQVTIVRIEDKTIVTMVQSQTGQFDSFLHRAKSAMRTVSFGSSPNQSR